MSVEFPNQVPENPLVSVCITTYNHEDYITECIESIVSQTTNFQFEILVGEDESTDNTRNICIEKAKKYNNLIRLQLNSREDVIYINNKPTGRNNLKSLFLKSRGKYIAFIEGDDFYSKNNKLQIQIDALETNSDCTVSSTSYLILNTNLNSKKIIHHKKGIYTYADVLKGIISPATCTLVFRRLDNLYFPDWFDNPPFGDFPLIQIHLSRGNLIVLDEVSATYRVHEKGYYAGVSDLSRAQNMLDTITILRNNLSLINPKIKNSDFTERESGIYYRMSYGNAAIGNNFLSRLYFKKYILTGKVSLRKMFRIFIFPFVLMRIIKIRPYI